MNANKRATMRERARRFRRRISGKDRAVSPVVATLILILIAVAAAAALYLWLVVWQGHITNGIGNVGAQPTLTIGGSTSVYPFDELAVTQFEQNYSDVVISNNPGGSGAGMLSVCNGAVDIGAASFPVTPSLLVSSYGCAANVANTAVVTTVAYDAVDVIVAKGNPHGLLSITYDTVAMIYQDATAAQGKTALLITTHENSVGNSTSANIPLIRGHDDNVTSSTPLMWEEIPAAIDGTVLSGGTAPWVEAPVADIGAGVAGCEGQAWLAHDICATNATTASPCGYTVCAGGSGAYAANAPIDTYARSDASGTTQAWEARIVDATSSTAFASQTTLNSAGSAGFSGCGSSNYISDCGYVATKTASGNPAVVAGVAADENSIGYASDGVARAAGTVALIPFTGVGQGPSSDKGNCGSSEFAGLSSTPTCSTWGGVVATTGASGTIADGIKGPTNSALYYTGYLGWRPFDLVTLTTPTAVGQEFLTFVLDPSNNQNLASESQEVSIYSV